MKESGLSSPTTLDVEAATNSAIIRPIANSDELSMVHRLTHDCYVAQGYATPQPDRRLIHYMDFDGLPQTTVIVAMIQNEVVGSVSLTLDGPWGLTVDKDFKKVCDSLREAGRSLSVIWRLVMKPTLNPSRHVLMALFRKTAYLAMLEGANTSLVTVNPKHKTVYQRLFNASEVTGKGSTKGLSNAPGVLLRADFENFPESWKNLSDTSKYHLAA